MNRTSRRSRLVVAMATGTLVGAGLFTANLAFANHPEVSLTGSNFEIDTDANLVRNDAAPSEDWSSVSEIRKQDAPSGTSDNSFGQGTKEDSPVPTVVSGSIPPNKSDLKFFGVYQEGTTSNGFLNMFWSRVQDPSGTTNMDFEFNRNKCEKNSAGVELEGSLCSTNGVTPARSIGDKLITYDLSNGGTVPTFSMRTWTGTAWGVADELATSGSDREAAGSINTSTIPDDPATTDFNEAHTPRTFGEAQIKLSAVLPTGTCATFGSAYLKSRSSDSFTAAVKDFVPPEVVNISNCGSVKVIKYAGAINPNDPTANRLNGAEFTLYDDVAPLGTSRDAGGVTDPVTDPVLKCTTAVNGTCTISDVPLGSYWLHETGVPTGYTAAPDQAVSVTGSTTVEKTFIDPVATVASSLSTQQRWLPNHKATVTLPNNNWGDLAGTVHFEMFENSSCTGVPKYTVDRSTTSDDTDGTAGGLTATVVTGNTTFYTSSQNVSWKVSFDPGVSRPNQVGSQNVCDKSSWTLGNNF